jgi:hypothetical protein
MASSILVGSFSPSSLSGCVLWLDGSSLGLSNGATVSSWSSLGPVSYTTSSTSGRFPTYATNVQNGRGCVQYATGQTSILSNFSLSGTQSIFLLYYPINTSAGSPFLEQGPDVNGNDGFYFHAQNNNNYAIRNGGTTGATNFGTTAVTNTWQLIEGLNRDPNAGNTMGFYCNATLLASNGVQNGVTPVTNTLFLNGRNNTNTLSYPAYVAELIIYDTPLNPFGRQQVEGYLAWKWGLTSFLPSNHPYKSVAYFTIIETVPRTIPTNSFLLPVNTFSTVKTITLPIVSTNPGRILVLKDYLGYAASNTIRVSTVGLDRIERSSVSSMILSNSYAAYWFTNDGMTNWFLTDAYLNSVWLQPFVTYSYPATPLVVLQASTYSGSGTWFDLSPNAANATLEFGTAAKNGAGNGIVLNGSTSWTFKNIAARNNWTTSIWYKNTGTPGGNGACIFTQIHNGTPINICLSIGTCCGNIQGYCFYEGPWRNGTSITLTNTSWTYYTATWNGTTMTTYINGVSQGSATPGGTANDGGLQYRIGRRWDLAAYEDYVVGEVGEVRVYSSAITAAQVLTDFNYTRTTYGV